MRGLALRVRRVHPDAKLPARATPMSVGYDLASVETVDIAPWSSARVRTGLELHLPPAWGALITGRSGQRFNRGVDCFVGTLDPDFTTEVYVLLTNLSDEPRRVQSGDRVGQLVLIPRPEFDVVETEEARVSTHRGFGSTGGT